MDALMAALVAAALAGIGDRPAWLAAILADRYRQAGAVIAAAAIALAAASGLAALMGGILAPRFSPEAKQMMLALALLLQGGAGFLRVKSPERLDGWRLGAFATPLLGLFVLAFGDGVQFIVLTLAARTALPWLAAIGGAVGGLCAVAPAALLGERGWTALPLRQARSAIAIPFLVAGSVLALEAMGLV